MKKLNDNIESVSKIYATDNPYSDGHKIEVSNWSERIDKYRLIWFDFHLKTEDYYAHDDENSEEEDEEHLQNCMRKATEAFKSQITYFEDYEFVDMNPKSNKREYKLDKLKQLTL